MLESVFCQRSEDWLYELLFMLAVKPEDVKSELKTEAGVRYK